MTRLSMAQFNAFSRTSGQFISLSLLQSQDVQVSGAEEEFDVSGLLAGSDDKSRVAPPT